MTKEQIISLVSSHITDALSGMTKEYPKLDFKTAWYNLKDEVETNEFIKDSSAIANTPGLDGFIVIGFDDNQNTFSPAAFSDSQLKDTNELDGMIIRRVDRNYSLAVYDEIILGHMVSIIHIPPSFDKPHVIKNYTTKKGNSQQHRVFIRRGTTTQLATKYDLDFIAYDRKNLIPEYSLFVSCSKSSMSVNHGHSQNVDLDIGLVIENSGLRPVAITEMVLTFFYLKYTISFISKVNREEKTGNNLIAVSNIIVQSATIQKLTSLWFTSTEKKTNSEFLAYSPEFSSFEAIEASIKLNTGKTIDTKVQII